ncbi:hypothetical protein [Burkholderia sp. PU8-34]
MAATTRQPAHAFENPLLALDVGAEEALRSAIGAATLLGSERVRALLKLSDEQSGYLFKLGISQVIGLADRVTFEGTSSTARGTRRSGHTKRRGKSVASADMCVIEAEGQIVSERQSLVTDGKLLPAAQIWASLGMIRQALSKAVASGRIFTVDVGASQYYPAFYLVGDIDRKTLGKVTQRLGSLPGWSKWQFFTSPKASLGNRTPLEALLNGQAEHVERAAVAFAER